MPRRSASPAMEAWTPRKLRWTRPLPSRYVWPLSLPRVLRRSSYLPREPACPIPSAPNRWASRHLAFPTPAPTSPTTPPMRIWRSCASLWASKPAPPCSPTWALCHTLLNLNKKMGEGFDGLNYRRFYTSVYEKQYDKSGWIPSGAGGRQGKPRAEIIRTFEVSRATIKRYLKLRRETGEVKAKAFPGRPAKKGVALLAGLKPQLDAYPDATLEDHCPI